MGVTVIGVGLMGRGIGTRLGTMSAEARAEVLPGYRGGSATATAQDARIGGEVVALAVLPDLLIAGDDERAKGQVAELARGGGLEAFDVGPPRRARQLEQVGFLHITLQDRLGIGVRGAVKFLW